jgi:hypothetical protein
LHNDDAITSSHQLARAPGQEFFRSTRRRRLARIGPMKAAIFIAVCDLAAASRTADER